MIKTLSAMHAVEVEARLSNKMHLVAAADDAVQDIRRIDGVVGITHYDGMQKLSESFKSRIFSKHIHTTNTGALQSTKQLSILVCSTSNIVDVVSQIIEAVCKSTRYLNYSYDRLHPYRHVMLMLML